VFRSLRECVMLVGNSSVVVGNFAKVSGHRRFPSHGFPDRVVQARPSGSDVSSA
jgi:hypothetical protein